MINVSKKIVRYILQSKTNIPKNSLFWPSFWKIVSYKNYPRSIQTTNLPENKTHSKELVFFQKILKERKSFRDFLTKKFINEEKILTLLNTAAGENEYQHRNYASGGMLYPIEIYYLGLDESSERKNLYHFSVQTQSLALIKKNNDRDFSEIVGSTYEFLNNASGLIIFTYIPGRNIPKYGWLGLRLALIEVGEIIQNIYLVSTFVSLKTCAVGGFSGEKVDELLEVDGLNELTVMILAVGE